MVTLVQVTELIAQLGGLTILAGSLAAVGGFVYRWYVREGIPRGLGLLVGLSGVAIYLNTTAALGQVIGGSGAPTETEVALFNITAFLVGAGGATLGQRAGDWAGMELFLGDGFADVEADVGRLVKSVGRVVSVSLPQDIDDVVGYDPVPGETRETLAGKTFLFPRHITVDALRERLVSRLKADYGVGHVDIELADDGSVEYLALGSRAAGIGPTLPPATNAVAIRADPAFAASAGDLVQVWETDPMRRVLTAELRGVADDTVTIAIDAADTQKLDPRTGYRLVTLPVEDRPDREFASLLRAADETFSSVTVEAGSPLHGLPVAALDLSVVAIKPEDETPMALPDPKTVLAPGDVVFAIARPDALRRLEVATEPLDPALVRDPSSPRRSQPKSAESEAQQPPAQTDRDAPAASPESEETAAPDTFSEALEPPEAPETADAAEAPEIAESADQTSDDGDSAVPADGSVPTAEADTAEAELEADTDETEPDEGTADFDPPAASDDGQSGGTEDSEKAGGSSFQQLKEEFDSGEAEWAEDESRNGDESATASASADSDDSEPAFEDESGDEASDDGDGLMDDDGLDSALDAAGDDDTFDTDESDDLVGLGFDEGDDDDLDSLGFEDDDEDDDLSSLSFDEDEDEDDGGLSLDAEEEDGDDEDDDSGGGGGTSSFQQLKEEFESGDADWEDDISDSPGGDMRLDE